MPPKKVWYRKMYSLTATTRVRRAARVLSTILVLSFIFYAHGSLRDFSSTTTALDELHGPEAPIAPTEPTTNEPPILLVSAMFPLPTSKHSAEDYVYWLREFLGPITTAIYFFTTPEFAPTIRSARGHGLPITVDTTYSSPFHIPPLKGLEEQYRKMYALDREKSIHSPDLYAIWNAKPFLLDHAVKKLAEKQQTYTYAFWNDAGSFRTTHRYKEWPSPRRVEQIWKQGSRLAGTPQEDLFFFPLCALPGVSMRYWKEDMGPVDYDVSEGSFFGGNPKTISWWSRAYYAYHGYYLSLGLFVGKDQTLINALMLLFPERFITVWYSDPLAPAHSGIIRHFDQGHLGACGMEWFYYQFWLADSQTRDVMRELWTSWTKWANWEWWRERQKCRMTGVLALKDLLARQFGTTWTPPARTLEIPTS